MGVEVYDARDARGNESAVDVTIVSKPYKEWQEKKLPSIRQNKEKEMLVSFLREPGPLFSKHMDSETRQTTKQT